MDNKDVKKFLTFKSGNFVFSSRFNHYEVMDPLYEVKGLYKTIKDLPILPDRVAKLEEELIRKSIFGTAAIEGNPLKEDEVEDIMSDPGMPETEARAEREILNLRQAYGLILEIASSEPVNDYFIGEDLIRKVHKVVTCDVNYDNCLPGKYRIEPVKVGNKEHGGVYTPPKCQADIKNLMREYIIWINSQELMNLDILLRAALAHYHLALIHPFGNGNGRTARIIESTLLAAGGIKYLPAMLSNYYYQYIDDYFHAFSLSLKSKDHDVTPFLKFVVQGASHSLSEIKDRIIDFIRILSIKAYLMELKQKKDIGSREQNLLLILLENSGMTFSLKDLFTVPMLKTLYHAISDRTARRDLLWLTQQNLLIVKEGKYKINIHCLE